MVADIIIGIICIFIGIVIGVFTYRNPNKVLDSFDWKGYIAAIGFVVLGAYSTRTGLDLFRHVRGGLNITAQVYRLFERINQQLNIKINHELLRQSRIMCWLSVCHVRQVQYYAGMKYISSLKKYQQQLTEGLRG